MKIKITDKVGMRAEALRLAIESDYVGMTPNNIIERAKAFEMYIQGEVALPEFMPIPDTNVSVNVCNGCCEEYDEEDDGIGMN